MPIIALVVIDVIAFAGFFVGVFSLLEAWVRSQTSQKDLYKQLDNLQTRRKSFEKSEDKKTAKSHLDALDNSIRSIETLLHKDVDEVRDTGRKQFRIRLFFVVVCFCVVLVTSSTVFSQMRKLVLPEQNNARVVEMLEDFTGARKPTKTQAEKKQGNLSDDINNREKTDGQANK